MTRSTDTIRRRPDGSIDTDHYVRRGRHQRSAAAHRLAARTARGAVAPTTGLGALVVAVLALFPGQG